MTVLFLFFRTQYKIAAVSMSIGGGVYSSYCDSTFPAIHDAVQRLKEVGIATVIASGYVLFANFLRENSRVTVCNFIFLEMMAVQAVLAHRVVSVMLSVWGQQEKISPSHLSPIGRCLCLCLCPSLDVVSSLTSPLSVSLLSLIY